LFETLILNSISRTNDAADTVVPLMFLCNFSHNENDEPFKVTGS